MIRSMVRAQVAFDVVVACSAAVLAVLLDGSYDTAWGVLGVGFGLALALRRMAPGIALAIAWLTAIAQMVFQGSTHSSDLLVTAVVYGTSAYGTDRVRRSGLASAIAGALVGGPYLEYQEWLVRRSLPGAPAENGIDPTTLFRNGLAYTVVILAILLLPWLAGVVVRARGAARMSREAQLLAERDAARSDRAVAVEQERVRIARDMHDIVAHSLAVVIAQADGARYALRASPDSADRALMTIATTARAALGDVRELLGALRHEQGAGPTPDADDVDRLVAGMRDVGLVVEVDRTGAPTGLGTTSQLAVYRVVQEALTNALKHGEPGEPVMLRIAYGAERVEVHIENRRARDGRPGPGTGHGLVGMRERAALSGGTMAAGIRGDDFVVTVRIPALPDRVAAAPNHDQERTG